MANLNKVMLIGRLTRDPEMRTFANGGRVAHFGFAVNNRKKNQQTGEWEEEPVYLDCDAFNRGEFGKLADTVQQYLKKGSQAFLEGHLRLDSWDDKTTGQKRNKLKLVVDAVQFLDRPPEGAGGTSRQTAPAMARSNGAPPPDSGYSEGYDSGPPEPPAPAGEGDNIPF
ncbi:MAG TPA: single-stranded DNA-binding protein [Gemmataceae bacterium]|jgi:single-strand DNA-binding protein|nr:single-stranded DNA-binding protein [Gemmataceae bacterium]